MGAAFTLPTGPRLHVAAVGRYVCLTVTRFDDMVVATMELGHSELLRGLLEAAEAMAQADHPRDFNAAEPLPPGDVPIPAWLKSGG